MPRLKAANNAVSELATSITASATELTLKDASSFPDEGPFRITIDNEIIEVGSINKATNTLSDLLRAQEGTTASPHDADTKVVGRWTAGMYSVLIDENELAAIVNGLNTSLDAHKSATPIDHPDGSVTAAKIANSAVTEAKIANSAVTAGKIADGAVDTLNRIASSIRTSSGGTEPNRIAVTDASGRVGDSAKLVGQAGSYYLSRANHTGTQAPSTISPQGPGSGLNADMVDGLHASSFGRVASGTYIGSGSTTRTVTIGFTPRLLFVTGLSEAITGIALYSGSGTFLKRDSNSEEVTGHRQGSSSASMSIVTSGFRIEGGGNPWINARDKSFGWVAIE